MPFFFVTGLSSDAPVPAEWVELGGGCTRGRCRRSTTRDMQTQRILILVLLIGFLRAAASGWEKSKTKCEVEPAGRFITLDFCVLSRYSDEFKSLVARNIMS